MPTLPAFTKTAAFDVGVSETVDRLNQAQGNTKDLVEGVKAMEKVRTVVAASTVTGTQNDYSLDGLAVAPDVGIGILNWSGASAVTFNGFAGGLAGRAVIIKNSTAAQTLTIATEAGGSITTNRCKGPAANLALGPRGCAYLWYDGVTSRWQVEVINLGDGTIAIVGGLALSGAASQILVGSAVGNALDSGSAGAAVIANSASFGTQLQIGANNDVAAYFNRKGSDGITVNLYNRGATVGNISTTATTTTFNSTSDARMKIDRTMERGLGYGLEVLRKTVLHDYDWEIDGKRGYGPFAQEAIHANPLAVTVGTDKRNREGRLIEPWLIEPDGYIFPLVAGWHDHEQTIQKLLRVTEELEARVAALESRLEATKDGIEK